MRRVVGRLQPIVGTGYVQRLRNRESIVRCGSRMRIMDVLPHGVGTIAAARVECSELQCLSWEHCRRVRRTSNGFGWHAAASRQCSVPTNATPPAPSQAPLARVIRNPDESTGLPPFAFADNMGTIQRYVEPVPGIDLEPYVGTVVRVRHDTGRTLLASQIDLPPQSLSEPIEPTDSEVVDVVPNRLWMCRHRLRLIARPARPATPSKRMIRPAEFVDDDDATVQLLAVYRGRIAGRRRSEISGPAE